MSKYQKIPRPTRLGFHCYVGDVQGCGTIRVIYPYFLLNHFRQKELMVVAMYLQNYVADPNFYKDFAFVQFQRSATKEHLKLMEHFKSQVQSKYPIPMIYEIDDMLFDIPEWNYAAGYYNQNRPIIEKLMSNCNGMITSTAKLREVYSPYCKKIAVVPNHLPKFIWGDIFEATDYKDEKDKIRILWAGSQNHFAMKEILGDKIQGGDFGTELLNFIRKTADVYDWHILGAKPQELENLKNKLHFHAWENIFNYPGKVKALEPDICIAPLQDIEFNRGKSNIKALEYTALGAPAVFSDVTPYKFQSCKAKTDEEFIYYIEKLAGDIDYRKKIFKKDYQRIRSQLWWEENDNIKKYINSYLNLFGKCL